MKSTVDPADPYRPIDFSRVAPAGGKPKNTIGTAGLVLSIVGLLIFPVLLVGVVFSLIGIRRPPKWVPRTGLAIGLAGIVFYGVIFAQSFPALAPRIRFALGFKEYAQTKTAMRKAVETFGKHYERHASLPDQKEGHQMIAELQDAWGNTLRYTPNESAFEIRSAGADGEYDTHDDLFTIMFDQTDQTATQLQPPPKTPPPANPQSANPPGAKPEKKPKPTDQPQPSGQQHLKKTPLLP